MKSLQNLFGSKKQNNHEIAQICRKSKEIFNAREKRVGWIKALSESEPYNLMWEDYSRKAIAPIEIAHLNFSRLFFDNAAFQEHHFVECDFSGSRWSFGSIKKCSFVGSNFSNNMILGPFPFQKTDFSRCNFTGADTDWFQFSTGNIFADANFSDAKIKTRVSELKGVVPFNQAVMKGCSLTVEEERYQKSSKEPEEIRAYLQTIFSPAQLLSMQILYRGQPLSTAVSENFSIEGSVERLVAIYRQHPEGFVRGSSGAAEQEVRRIGSILQEQGAMASMLEAHKAFTSACGINGAPRNLEHMWDGIGEWRG